MNRYYAIPGGIQEILVVFICYKDFVPTGTKEKRYVRFMEYR
jgi:hypothetical protein